MISTSDIKKGLCIKYSNDIYKIIEFLHVKPGKGPAFVRTKLKSVTSGKVIDNTFPAGHKIDDIRVENRKYQYLYNDGSTFHFMNTDDYNQIEVQIEQIEGSELEVTSSEPGVKGNTATNATKSAVLETGLEVNVPLFINEGDKIKVDTEKGVYVERIKE